ncbi:colicin-like bacteriocin tRNase domain-containing protein [Klebsiella michiganensis]|uniref:colicin-like bacteriocin tRNase domain-containing protein n=1 Tax=Klebsiella michiganensis TaxID=1134687 RepID=UPI001370F540|nr:hypothetical protein [Klebsiella michiganensis]
MWFPLRALTDNNISTRSAAPESAPVHTRILDDVRGGAQFISAVSSATSQFNLRVVKAVVRLDVNPFSDHLLIFRGRKDDAAKILWGAITVASVVHYCTV